jgi:hypothetical protein
MDSCGRSAGFLYRTQKLSRDGAKRETEAISKFGHGDSPAG